MIPADSLESFLAVEVQPVAKKCEEFLELWAAHGAQYELLLQRYELLAKENGRKEVTVVPFSPHAVDEIAKLVAIEESCDIQGLLILLNTVGGDIEAGLALAELIAGMKKPTVSLVLGGGHSIGVPLAVSAKRSFIAPSATMTIHPVRINGLVLGVPQAFLHFQRMQERIIRFVTDHSHITHDTFAELCMNTDEMATDMGSVLDGQAAVDVGLIDELGSLSDALRALHEMIDNTR